MPKATTEISAPSSSSESSIEDGFVFKRRRHHYHHQHQHHNHSHTRTPKHPNISTSSVNHNNHYRCCDNHSHRGCRGHSTFATISKRSTMPSTTSDGVAGNRIQLCREHWRALKHLSAATNTSKDRIATPITARRPKNFAATVNQQQQQKQQFYCSCCSPFNNRQQTQQRFTEKARSHDPFESKATSIRHRCSASPVLTLETMQSECDLCRKQHRFRNDCPCDCVNEDDDVYGNEDDDDVDIEPSDADEEGFSSSRAVSDSSLTSSAVPMKDFSSSTMVSSYEFEHLNQQQATTDDNNVSTAATSGGLRGGAAPRSPNKPPPMATPKLTGDRRVCGGATEHRRRHVNFSSEFTRPPPPNLVKFGRAQQVGWLLLLLY